MAIVERSQPAVGEGSFPQSMLPMFFALLLTKAGLTRKQLVKRLEGVRCADQIRRILAGRSFPTARTMLCICQALGIGARVIKERRGFRVSFVDTRTSVRFVRGDPAHVMKTPLVIPDTTIYGDEEDFCGFLQAQLAERNINTPDLVRLLKRVVSPSVIRKTLAGRRFPLWGTVSLICLYARIPVRVEKAWHGFRMTLVESGETRVFRKIRPRKRGLS